MTPAFQAAISAYNERRWEDAIHRASDALKLEPNNLDALEVFGLAWFRLGQLGNAIEALEFCQQQDGRNARYACNLGELYRAAGQMDKCVAMLSIAAQLDPQSIAVLESSGLALVDTGDLTSADAALTKVAQLHSDRALAQFNLGEVRRLAGRFEDAISCYEEALRLDPGLLQAQHQRALSLLAHGDYAHGWDAFEHRLDPRLSKQVSAAEPRWQGVFEQGQRVFVYSDQGLGDAILFARYLPHLAEQGVNLLVAVPPPLLGLFRAAMPGIEFIALGDARPACDWQIALGSLPGLYQTRAGHVPNVTPYLKARPEKIAAWRNTLARSSGTIKIGITWAGNSATTGVKYRNCPVEQFATVFRDIPSLTLVNLQMGAADELNTLRDVADVVDLTGEIADFEDTAAVLASLDMVISVDTALLNLAGAVHVPAWGLLALAPEWRWHGPDRRSRWYPSVIRYTQTRFLDWGAPLSIMRSTLLSHINAAVVPALNGRQ
ncbi:MAG: tetratricopeptide repeat protein [Burkholderiales bacterium]|nr:tetratricopeptide repeat protein [Burkholderiales bacterium]